MLNMMKTIKSGRKTGLILSGTAVVLVAVFVFLKISASSDSGIVPYSVKTFETKTGWGYSVFLNEREIIHQDVIPVISNEVSFKTKNEALKTARVVAKKLKDKKLPYLTANDLKELKISIPNS